MRTCDRSQWSAYPCKHDVWLCSHRLPRGVGQAGTHTLYACGDLVHTLSVSSDIPPSEIGIEATSILEVCLMRSQACSDLLYESTSRSWNTVLRSTGGSSPSVQRRPWRIFRIWRRIWKRYGM